MKECCGWRGFAPCSKIRAIHVTAERGFARRAEKTDVNYLNFPKNKKNRQELNNSVCIILYTFCMVDEYVYTLYT